MLTCQFFSSQYSLLLDTFNTYHSTKICAKKQIPRRQSVFDPTACHGIWYDFFWNLIVMCFYCIRACYLAFAAVALRWKNLMISTIGMTKNAKPSAIAYSVKLICSNSNASARNGIDNQGRRREAGDRGPNQRRVHVFHMQQTVSASAC